ncbi:hypothetical protein RvY_05361 [Ramazzottius varieornatus]|uniref:Uncharacterized protein n=1 Tax=Ramazzottius varieornatus TaxID=947166 RepID=A0A1D1UUS4_RAMVA|nr:hypothetical protein RvY_05361 [Ramazzottius varieornatus]
MSDFAKSLDFRGAPLIRSNGKNGAKRFCGADCAMREGRRPTLPSKVESSADPSQGLAVIPISTCSPVSLSPVSRDYVCGTRKLYKGKRDPEEELKKMQLLSTKHLSSVCADTWS